MGGGDPGNKLVNHLRRLGYTYVVLPYESLAEGHVAAPAVEESSMDVVARVRMLDCLEDLGG